MRKMADFKALTPLECALRILEIENPLVVMHQRPDGDTVGSGAALCRLFLALGKKPLYTCADEIPARLAFLTEGLEFTDNFEGRTAVAIDVASPSQLGALEGKITPALMIDHHKTGIPFADFYTVSDSSSAGEVLYTVILELEKMGKISVDKTLAVPLYASISSDTGGFIFSSAKESTHIAAARLISLGIDSAEINRLLFNSKSKEQILAEGMTAGEMKTAFDGRVSYAAITKKMREGRGLPFSAFECAIDVVRALENIEICFVIKETDAGEFKASLRSVGKNVAEIASLHGGGGHIRAAGCTIKAESIGEAEKILLCELEEAFYGI